MTQTADGAKVRVPRRARDDSALFVVVREERGSTDIRFIGTFAAAALQPLPDVLRQVMRRAPSFVHLDLREVSAVDDDGVKHLAHAAHICRRHGGMVKISLSAEVESAVDAAGSGAALGMLPRNVRDDVAAPGGGDASNGSRGPAPRF